MKSAQGFAPVVLLIVSLIVGAAAVFAYLQYNTKSSKSQPTYVNQQSASQAPVSSTVKPSHSPDLGTSSVSNIKGFKLYKNIKYKTSFTYPEEWKLEAKDSGGTYPMLDIHLSNGVDSNNPAQCTPSYAGLEIQVGHHNSENKTFDEIVKQQTASGSFGMGGSLEKFKINGKSSYKLERSGWDTPCKGPGYFIQQDENSYTYVFTGKGSEANFDVTEKIVTSIKFEQ